MSNVEDTRTTTNADAGLKRVASSHWVLEEEHKKATQAVAAVLAPFKARAVAAKKNYQLNQKSRQNS